MISLHAQALDGDFLERPAAELEAEMQAGAGTEDELAAGTAAGPYLILGLLGRGGMGEVYKARDTRLDREVALKFLPRRFADDARWVERFRREARTASALNHANICSIYDIAEWNGQPFLVMELLEGRTLAQRLTEGALTRRELESVARQTAAALTAAHDKGIIHRDMKPSNIFLCSSGIVKILDFGVAKVISEAQEEWQGRMKGDAEEGSFTHTGTVMGTLPYMSPEQVRGEALDARSDLFSLGATLYQAATGTAPFQGSSVQQTRVAILDRAPVPPSRREASVSRRWDRLILKSLAKKPEDRYRTAQELEQDLGRLGRAFPAGGRLAATLIAAAVLGAVLFSLSRRGAEPGPAIQRLAVLPLQNLMPAGGEPVAEGIADAIASDLMKLPGLRVTARASAARYRGTDKKASEAGRELGVDAVVRGLVRPAGDRMEVQVELVQTSTDQPMWAESFNVSLIGIMQLKSDVARAVARKIRLRLLPADESRLAAAGTRSQEAFEAYLRGRHYWEKRTDSDIERAIALFRQAIDADPTYAAAYAALADCYNQFATVRIGRPPAVNRPLAIAAARQAIQIDGQSAEAHAALGFAYLYDWNWAGADVELRRALELNPSYSPARVWHATYLTIRRRFDEAIAEVEGARDLDPLSVITQTQVGWIYNLAGRDREAVREFEKALAMDPGFGWALWQLGGTYSSLGMHREALAVLEKAASSSGGNATMLGALGEAYAAAGQRDKARQMLSDLRRMARQRYVTPVAPLYICLALGDRDCFFESLEAAYRERANYVAFLNVEPAPGRYAAIRADPRFQAVLKRLGY